MAAGGQADASISEGTSNYVDLYEENDGEEGDDMEADFSYSNTPIDLSEIYAKKDAGGSGINHDDYSGSSVEQGCGPSQLFYSMGDTEMPSTSSYSGIWEIPQITLETLEEIMQAQKKLQTLQNSCGGSTWNAPEPEQQHGRVKKRRLAENLRTGGYAALKIKEHTWIRRSPWVRFSRLLHLKEAYANYLRRGGVHEVLRESDRVKKLITKKVEDDPAVWKLYL